MKADIRELPLEQLTVEYVPGQLLGQMRLRLSGPQIDVVRTVIEKHQAMGDVELRGCILYMSDYEGASAFLHSVQGLPAPAVGTVPYVQFCRMAKSHVAVQRKVNAAVIAACNRKSIHPVRHLKP